MSVMLRAMMANVEASELQEKNMNRHIARKERDNEELKRMNKLLDHLTEDRADNGFSTQERADLVNGARALGIEITDAELSEVDEGYENGRYGTSQLDPTKSGTNTEEVGKEKDEAWGKARREALDKIAQKIERAIKAAEDESGATSLHLNLSMNKYTQKLQDANGVVSAIKDLEGALTLRG